MALVGTRQLCSQGPVCVHTHRIERVTGCERREDANGNGDGDGVGGGNKDVNNDGEGDGAGTRTVVEANEGTQDENGDEQRGTSLGRVKERRVCAKKKQKSRGHGVENEGNLGGGKNYKTRNYWFSSCANLAWREAQGTQGLMKNCRCRGSVSVLSRLLKSLRNKYH